MKIILFFLLALLVETSIAQKSSLASGESLSTAELKSKVQGDWYLSEIELVDGYSISADSNRYFSAQKENRKIVFEDDCLTIFPDSTKRFYTAYQQKKYHFDIEYDSIYQSNFLKVFASKKKSNELESYEIIRCGIDELILKSTHKLNNTLELARFSVYSVYRRENIDSLLSMLEGNWYHCSSDYHGFGFDTTDYSEITFHRNEIDSLCSDYDLKIELNFYRMQHDHYCAILSYSKFIGTMFDINFMLDPKNMTLYMGKNNYIIYDLITLNQNELKLTLNSVKTGPYDK